MQSFYFHIHDIKLHSKYDHLKIELKSQSTKSVPRRVCYLSFYQLLIMKPENSMKRFKTENDIKLLRSLKLYFINATLCKETRTRLHNDANSRSSKKNIFEEFSKILTYRHLFPFIRRSCDCRLSLCSSVH